MPARCYHVRSASSRFHFQDTEPHSTAPLRLQLSFVPVVLEPIIRTQQLSSRDLDVILPDAAEFHPMGHSQQWSTAVESGLLGSQRLYHGSRARNHHWSLDSILCALPLLPVCVLYKSQQKRQSSQRVRTFLAGDVQSLNWNMAVGRLGLLAQFLLLPLARRRTTRILTFGTIRASRNGRAGLQDQRWWIQQHSTDIRWRLCDRARSEA